MNDKRNAIFAWIFFALITAAVLVAVIFDWTTRPVGDQYVLSEMMFPLIPIAFVFVGALIISRQPRNVIGWLMLLPGVSLFIVVDVYLRPYTIGILPPPESPSLLFLLILWFSNWNWLLLVFPILFIMVLFPTGKPLSRRWGWLIYFGLGLMALLIVTVTFAQELTVGSGAADWTLPNPIGFMSIEFVDSFIGPWVIAIPLLTILCAASLFVRFRRARAVERQQIKWLFYATAVFVAFYVPTFVGNAFAVAENIWNVLFAIGMLGIPAAIAIAILRYRLYDIDVIIRKTLVYGLLTALLAFVYFGSIVLLQTLFDRLTGEQSPIIIVLSTLLIAALFTPLRRRVQDVIDRRFFRKKYDAAQVLADFARHARDETDLDSLTAELARVVGETMQPEIVGVWLKERSS